MATITVSYPQDGDTIDAADVNNPLQTIVSEFNGNIDDTNIKSGANINASKLLASSVSATLLDANTRGGWQAGILPAPNTVTYNGNRSYDVVINSTDVTGYISPGMRLRATRTVTAPTQSTSLNGTTQYYSKTSPAGMTFTDDFVASAWIKLSNYPSSDTPIAGRFDGNQGWWFGINTYGQLVLTGHNAAAVNYNRVISVSVIPLNKWVHVAAQLDMSTAGVSTTTSYTMLNGVDIPCVKQTSGTAPTSLVQAGNLNIGTANSGTGFGFFPGKIAQFAIYNAKVTQSTVVASISQTLSGSETSLISAYSFNGVITDLNTTNANNLTANGSAVATATDSPFGQQADGTTAGTTDYAIVQKASFSTNTTLTVQVPEGNTLPTTGGISALAYSVHKAPYGMPISEDKWVIDVQGKTLQETVSPVQNTWYNALTLTVPVGAWRGYIQGVAYMGRNASTNVDATYTLSTANNSESDANWTYNSSLTVSSATNYQTQGFFKQNPLTVSAATPYYLNYRSTISGMTTVGVAGTITPTTVRVVNAYL